MAMCESFSAMRMATDQNAIRESFSAMRMSQKTVHMELTL